MKEKIYKIEYLPSARKDILEIVDYIANHLKNPDAAAGIVDSIVKKCERLADMPYRNPAYYPIRPLKYDYRKAFVKNYIIFYRVDEISKLITIVRIIYSRRDYEKDLS